MVFAGSDLAEETMVLIGLTLGALVGLCTVTPGQDPEPIHSAIARP
jgi:hypothetical protein